MTCFIDILEFFLTQKMIHLEVPIKALHNSAILDPEIRELGKKQPSNPVSPIFPDEVLLMFIEYLSPKDQLSLAFALSCKVACPRAGDQSPLTLEVLESSNGNYHQQNLQQRKDQNSITKAGFEGFKL